APGDEPMLALAAMQMARRTDDRYRDVPEKTRARVLRWLGVADAPSHYGELVERASRLDAEEQGLVFGETLPAGLRIL
ncbi:MAG TPA: hypothetical protein VJL29_12335, partial [Thermoguttaceae bacterium]|nr:hypothetical protein [Thermoguttaceae bacterium]